jgi:hypothetical protein
VDVRESAVTVAWRDASGDVHERDFPRPCLHRVAFT